MINQELLNKIVDATLNHDQLNAKQLEENQKNWKELVKEPVDCLCEFVESYYNLLAEKDPKVKEYETSLKVRICNMLLHEVMDRIDK